MNLDHQYQADLWQCHYFLKIEEGKDDWRAQCLARQLYIKQTIKQIYKAICKAHEKFDKRDALHQSFVPIRRNGQQLLNFIEEVKDHYEQVKAFYGYNCNILNNV